MVMTSTWWYHLTWRVRPWLAPDWTYSDGSLTRVVRKGRLIWKP